MKLLIITQVIDKQHPILGFFHRWVEEFAKQCEQVHVICLEQGSYDLPANVTVHSLGKEAGKGRLTYLYRFFQIIWKLRHEYDNVFVHMNQIYVILGAPFWRTLGKKVGLWYAHGTISPSLKVAAHLAHHIFTSTEEGLQIATPKKVIVGQGIDTANFKMAPKSANDALRLITVGRISKSKNLETLLRACALLKERGVDLSFKIVGAPITDGEREYDNIVKKLAADLGIEASVQWVGAISNHELPKALQTADIFIHDGATKSLDKALLEAALCGCIVVSSNEAYTALTSAIAPEYLFRTGDFTRLSEIIAGLNTNTPSAQQVRILIQSNYDISHLISGIVDTY